MKPQPSQPGGVLKNAIGFVFVLLLHLDARAQHTIMRTFNMNDGLVSNQVRHFYQDSHGFMWVMTWEGLSRFDGYRFRNYTTTNGLDHAMINAMYERNQTLYIAENNGTIDVLRDYDLRPELRIQDGHPINAFVIVDEGILTASDELGIRSFEVIHQPCLGPELSQLSVTDFVSHDSVFLICGTQSGVIDRRQKFIRVWPDSLNEYNCILKDLHQRVWVGTTKGIKWVAPAEGPDAYALIQPPLLLDAPWCTWAVLDIAQSSDGSIWVASIGGLIQIRTDLSWRVFTRNDGLPADYVTTVYESDDGLIWIGTDQGCAQLDIRNSIEIFRSGEEIPNEPVTDILPTMDGGAFIIINGTALSHIQPDKTTRSVSTAPGHQFYHFLVVHADTIVSTDQGYYQINNQEFKPWKKLPYTLSWYGTTVDNTWVLSSVNDMLTAHWPEGEIARTAMHDMVFTMTPGGDGDAWIGALTRGLFRVQPKILPQQERILELTDYNQLLPEKTIRALHMDSRHQLWVGTRWSGLVSCSVDSVTRYASIRNYRAHDGLLSDFVRSITSDGSENIWVGTFTGIDKLVLTDEGYRVFPFSRINNFFASVTKIARGPDPYLWGITSSGVVRIRDGKDEAIPPPEAYFTSVSTARNVLVDPVGHLPYELRAKENFIEIEFSSIDHVQGSQTTFSYRLIGSQDTMWSVPKRLRKVSYANLSPGLYRFEVRVQSWSARTGGLATYQFLILPPFWRQKWFVSIALVVALSVLYWAYRYRINQLKQMQDVRNRIASDLHDEIGSSLTHVNILSELGQNSIRSGASPAAMLARISEEAQTSADALDDIIWSVSSRADTTDDLISRMRRYASELFDTKGIAFLLQEQNVDMQQTLALDLRRDFYLIYKEILRNILKHAQATEVKITISREKTLLWLSIADNGIGFDPDLVSDRQGLHSIRRRAGKWKGQVLIDSSPETGTMVKVGLPYRSTMHFVKPLF